MKKALSTAIGLLLTCNILFGQTPTIITLSPATGPVGTVVTINGSNLSIPTAFSIGGQSAIVVSNTGSTLVAMVMPGAVTGQASVTTAGGTANGGTFTVTSTNFPSVQDGAKLVGTGDVPSAQEGYSVAVSADGNTAIVGGPGDNGYQGAVWIYIRSGGVWTQQGQKLVGTGGAVNPELGTSVSLSADGNTAMVGAQYDSNSTGAVWVFVRVGGVWTQQGSKLAGTAHGISAVNLGCSVSLSADGNSAIVGGFGDSGTGAAWIYTRSGGTWTQGSKLTGADSQGGDTYQGHSVAMSADGNTAVVGGYNDNSGVGAAWIYTRSGNTWTQQGAKLVGTGGVGTSVNQGYSVAISADGNTAMVGGDYDNSGIGAVWVYTRSGGAWSQQGSKLVGTGGVGNPMTQGCSVSLSADGNTAIVGGCTAGGGLGQSWVYTRTGGTWAQQGSKLVGTGSVGTMVDQGISVSLSADGSTAIIGGAEDNSFDGAAWVFKFVQLPEISYASPQIYNVGNAITPLVPASAVVAAPGYSSTAVTLASGLNAPLGIAVDAAGNVYVADAGNNAVKKIPAGGGTPVAIGSGFSGPHGVAVDVAGNVYVADRYNNAVKEIPVGGGSPVTLGSGFSSPFGVALDAAGNIYVADYGNNVVKKIPAGNGTPVTIGSGFSSPTGVAVDAAGNVYVSDFGHGMIRKIPAGGGSLVTVASGFNYPMGVALDPAGNVFVCEYGNTTLKEIPAGGGSVVSLGPTLVYQYAAAVDAFGNIFVADWGNNAAKEIKPVGGYYLGTPLPAGLTIAPATGVISGTPTAPSPAANYTITAYNANGGTSTTVNIAVALPLPTIKYTTPNIYTAGAAIPPLKPTSTIVAPPAYSGIDNVLISSIVRPLGLAVDPSGNVFIGNSGFSNLTEIPAGGGLPETFGFGFNGPVDAATDAAGNVYVADYGNQAVKKIPTGTGITPVTIGSGFSEPYGVAVDAAGNVYVADRGSNTVQKIPAAGGPPVAIGSGFTNPSGVAIDGLGNVYVADSGNNAIKEIPAGGGAILTLGTGFVNPFGVAVDPSGNIFVADTGNGRVVELPTGGTQAVISSNFTLNTGVAIDQYGVVYMSDQLDNIVYSTKPSGGYYISSALPTGLSFSNATGIISGTPIGGSPVKNYTITAYNAYGSASAVVNIAVAGSAALSAFKISNDVLTPTFSAATTSYSANVANGVASMTVTPTAVDPSGTIKVNGVTVSSGNPSQSLPLVVGSDTIAVAVTSGDGVNTKTYTLVVTRAPSANASLATLGQSIGGLMPAFASGTTSYAISAGNAAASITLKPVSSDATATIKVNGTTVTSGTTTAPIALSIGPNTITTAVTAQNGVTTKTYTLTVTRAVSANATLSSIKLSSGTLSPAFTSVAIGYTASVANAVSSITITAASTDANATIKVNGTTVTSGTASTPIALAEGAQVAINLVVTAQDGATTKTYTVTVTRAPSANANLSTLGQSVGGLTPAFTTGTTNYTENVSNATATITLKPVSSDANATITVNGTAVVSGAATAPIVLAVGPNTIITVVTAQNATTTKTYTVTVTRAASGANGYVPIAIGTGISVTKPTETSQLVDDGIVVHQALSPNGDGINDFLQIDNISQYPDNKLMIMNRNGQLIYEAKGYDNSSKTFDGHSNKNGQMQLPGTYFYQLDYTANGITKHKTGFLVLKY